MVLKCQISSSGSGRYCLWSIRWVDRWRQAPARGTEGAMSNVTGHPSSTPATACEDPAALQSSTRPPFVAGIVRKVETCRFHSSPSKTASS